LASFDVEAGQGGFLAIPGSANIRPRLARSSVGVPRASFGDGGLTRLNGLPCSDSQDSLTASVVLGDRLYAVGNSLIGGTPYPFVACFNLANGRLDTSFAGKGWLFLPQAAGETYSLNSCALQATAGSNYLIVAGLSYDGTAYHSQVARLQLDGRLDTAFGANDFWRDTIAQVDAPVFCQVDSVGRILVAYTENNTLPMVCAARLTATGVLDSSLVSAAAACGPRRVRAR